MKTPISLLVGDYQIHSPRNLPDFDGLFFRHESMKGLSQLIFRHDFMEKDASKEWHNKIVRHWDNFNTSLKMVRLVNPMIMPINDTAQAWLAVGGSAMAHPVQAGKAVLLSTEIACKLA